MHVHGLAAQVEAIGDLLRRVAFTDLTEDFELTIRQPTEHGIVQQLVAVGGSCRLSPDQRFVKDSFAGVHLADGVDDMLRILVLGKIGTTTGPDDAFAKQRFLVHGQRDDRELRVQREDILDQVQSAFAFQGQIGHQDIGGVCSGSTRVRH